MITGEGTLILRDGRRIPLAYSFAPVYDDLRVGHLTCDTSTVDPAAFFGRLTVECDDGTTVLIAVMHHGDRYIAVTGRVLPTEQSESEPIVRAAAMA
ncbi:hypothetical protein [Bosea rubneri]|uniref:Uncharacterized protein n=1 Tax=Bosea rubneri TaxID=3075434 RepID=A0ABU3SEH9_9HYPH|nr:hypothetical protein [Bosea sp. ZW T0_25]MDU0343184.1 hypothetical protein [Bosea sp. ZW T0_25]